jgi:transglutaminase-like putative cysteine protease
MTQSQSQSQLQSQGPMPEIWRLLIVHRTVLTYPDTVTTSYNEVRMQPSDEPGQAVLSARLEIDPFEGVMSYIDYFGTRVSAFDIHRPHRHLAVTATTTVETFPPTESWPGAVPSGSIGYAPSITPMSWEQLAESDAFDKFEEYLTPTPLTALDDELSGIAARDRHAPLDRGADAVCVGLSAPGWQHRDRQVGHR